MQPGSSYDAGERLHVTRDGPGGLLVSHGARDLARIKRTIGGGVRVDADERCWRLALAEDGWRAEGEPEGSLRRRVLRSAVLTVGDAEYGVRGRTVKGLLRFRRVTRSGRPAVEGEILSDVASGLDGHAVIALATAAVVLGVDLTTTSVGSEVNGDNISAAIRYGAGAP